MATSTKKSNPYGALKTSKNVAKLASALTGQNISSSFIRNAAKGSSTPTTPTPTTPTTTTTTGGGGGIPTAGFNYQNQDDYLRDYYGGTELTKQEEETIRRNAMNTYQGEINAAKSAYSQLLAEQQQLGVGRLGESTAIQARRGLQGSSFGQGMTEETRGLNLKNERQVLSDQAVALANIQSRMQAAISQEMAAKRAAKQGGYAAYQTYQATLPEKRKNYATEVATYLLNSGQDYTALDKATLTQLQGLGLNQQDIISAYLGLEKEQEAAEAQAAIDGRFTLGEGEAMLDAEGNIIAQRAKTYAPKDGGGQKLVTINGKTYVQNDDGTYSPPDLSETYVNDPSSYSKEKADNTTRNVDLLIEKAKASPGIFGRTAALPISDALRSNDFRDFRAQLQTLKSNIAFNELAAMREASKTGGALGNVSNIELGLLESTLGALDMSQSPENYVKQLEQIKDSIRRFQEAVQNEKGQRQTSGGTPTDDNSLLGNYGL